MATYRETIRDEHGQVIAAACVTEPLTDQARAALGELVHFARKLQQERDPENVLGDRQRRRIDRLMKRKTPECPYCDRIENHDGRCLSAAEVVVLEEAAKEAAARSGEDGRDHG